MGLIEWYRQGMTLGLVLVCSQNTQCDPTGQVGGVGCFGDLHEPLEVAGPGPGSQLYPTRRVECLLPCTSCSRVGARLTRTQSRNEGRRGVDLLTKVVKGVENDIEGLKPVDIKLGLLNVRMDRLNMDVWVESASGLCCHLELVEHGKE